MRLKIESNLKLSYQRVFILTLTVCFWCPVFAQTATLQGNILAIPTVLGNGSAYNVELLLENTTDPVSFGLLAAVETTLPEDRTPSVYDNGVLFVPDIDIAGDNYWAELSGSSNIFTLKDFGSKASIGAENQVGISTDPIWQRMLGEATDIAIGADGSAWVLGTDERKGGFGIYHWNGVSWGRIDGAAVRIAVAPDGTPWVVNDSHQIYRLLDGLWVRLQGDARDISIGADGSVWVAAGGGIYKWDGDLDFDIKISGAGVRIAVDPQGVPWVTDDDNDIYQWIGGRWVRRPGEARDIGIGADGSVWIVGTRSDGGGHGIYRWTGDSWNLVQGSARHISVDPDGNPWTVGSDGHIYRSVRD
ncbi:MAG: hypothetical protein HOF74_01335 [Gammaproteobacteria bacterium]|jgi:hypothetical protein|nr:hypothetical protein [Gammaproteobacteria bacterium]MBT3858450.1 hypothetical protein [Gammaproteobacteria bacterium]MBT3986812.1 hypothetical protein [Gammaproteobacteria bacterium]MBT4657631.1 hypothetical protein [Gammaproteobacteria bacterium]MBT4892148.1 hypothetical protein [Gammaproteobacteria bacterium]